MTFQAGSSYMLREYSSKERKIQDLLELKVSLVYKHGEEGAGRFWWCPNTKRYNLCSDGILFFVFIRRSLSQIPHNWNSICFYSMKSSKDYHSPMELMKRLVLNNLLVREKCSVPDFMSAIWTPWSNGQKSRVRILCKLKALAGLSITWITQKRKTNIRWFTCFLVQLLQKITLYKGPTPEVFWVSAISDTVVGKRNGRDFEEKLK